MLLAGVLLRLQLCSCRSGKRYGFVVHSSKPLSPLLFILLYVSQTHAQSAAAALEQVQGPSFEMSAVDSASDRRLCLWLL